MENSPISAKEALEKYFLDNRARLLEIASFLDRIERYKDSSEARNDFRYKSFVKAIQCVLEDGEERTRNIQMIFSDISREPVETVNDPKAYGASRKAGHEGN